MKIAPGFFKSLNPSSVRTHLNIHIGAQTESEKMLYFIEEVKIASFFCML